MPRSPSSHVYLLLKALINSHAAKGQPVPAGLLGQCMECTDRRVQNLAYSVFCDSAFEPLPGEEVAEFCLRFLEGCLRSESECDDLPSRWDASRNLAAWIEKLWKHMPTTNQFLAEVRTALGRVLREEPEAREPILLGALEHLFVDKTILAYFEVWKDDRELSPIYDEAAQLAALWRAQETGDSAAAE